MKDPDETRIAVAHAYAKAVTRAAPSCGSSSTPSQKGEAARLAGYSSTELGALPSDAVINSFGCGNPLAFSGVEEGDTVLDLGSGAGIDLLIAARRVGPSGRVIGVDMTDEMIAKARGNVAAAGHANVEIRKGIIEDLPVEDSSVDWVISNCVINLSPDKPQVFREIARVLKPGGQMAVSDIVVEELPDWVRQNDALYSCCVAGAISEDDYLDGLRESGLVDVQVRERLVYEASQLRAIIQSDSSDSGACCGGAADDGSADRLANDLAGKVWSAKVHARMPV